MHWHTASRGVVGLLAVAVAVSGCLEDSSGPPANRVRGTIEYDGAAVGTLVVSAYATFPPRGDPLVTVAIDEPVFPATYELEIPGTVRSVFVLAMLDLSPEDGFRYHSTIDAGGAFPSLLSPGALAITPGVEGRADFGLLDPRPGLPSP